MTVYEILRDEQALNASARDASRSVQADMLSELLTRLVSSDSLRDETTGDKPLGALQQTVGAMSKMIPFTGEDSEIHICCTPQKYSASSIAHAVEDADAMLLSLLAYPDSEGMLDVYLRINRTDPSATVRSLERYGFIVRDARGASYSDADASIERLNELQHYLNI